MYKRFGKLKQHINLWHISEYPKPLLPIVQNKTYGDAFYKSYYNSVSK